MTDAEDPADPWTAIEDALKRAEGEGDPGKRDRALLAALATADLLGLGVAGRDPRAKAYRAEILRRLGRLSDAAKELRGVVEGRVEDGDAAMAGLKDLLDSLCGYEEILAIAPRLEASLPGRRWRWEPAVDEARKRMRLEHEAPLSPEALVELRAGVARRLAAAGGCRHDDDRRPLSAAVAREMGLDPDRVLRWLSDLGACCCDCQVARVAGPREPRGGGTGSRGAGG